MTMVRLITSPKGVPLVTRQQLCREQVIAFRLRAHGLAERRPAAGVLAAAAACAVQNSPPGAALLALAARIEDLAPEVFDDLVETDKTLLQTWSMRGAPFFFPSQDAAVFTTGVLPPTEAGRLQLVIGVEQALQRVGIGLDDLVDLLSAQIGSVLVGRRLAINELGRELAEALSPQLSPSQARAWRELGPYAKDQPLGEAIVHFALRISCLRGELCFAPRRANKAPFVLVDEWLDAPPGRIDADQARAELLRRYLSCYGPSTPAEFASWLGVRVGDTHAWWQPAADQLAEVDFAGRRCWALRESLAELTSASGAHGVRLLPPGDPYTQQRDRQTLIDKVHHRTIWRPLGAPGCVLVDGQIAGTWRAHKSGRALALTVEPFTSLSRADRERLHHEAEQMAALRGTDRVTLAVEASR